MKIYAFCAIAAASFAGILVANAQDRALAESVRNGTVNLTCEFRDGSRRVDPELVESFSDGRWFFSNGSAVNCEVAE